MYLPHRRIDDFHIFDENVAAAICLNERWPEISAFTKLALRGWNATLSHCKELLARLVLARPAGFPAEVRVALPWPPMRIVGLAVERSRSGYSDVLAIDRVYERRVIHYLYALETRQHRREIFSGVRAEQDRRSFRNMEIHVAAKMDG